MDSASLGKKLSVVLVASIVVAAVFAATALAKTVKPKLGVYGSPANSKCYSGSVSTKCKGTAFVYKEADGKLKTNISHLRTGCEPLDRYLLAGGLLVKKAKFSHKSSGLYNVNGNDAQITFTVSGEFTSSKKASVKFRATTKSKNTGCKSSSFQPKTVEVKWFSSTDNGG